MKKIVFDCDDVLHDLNGKLCRENGINIEKITVFNIYQSSMLTQREKETLMGCYKNAETFAHIDWYPEAERLHEIQEAGGDIFINSNCFNEKTAYYKKQQLLKLGIPEDHIFLNIITQPDSHKGVGEDIFINVDDHPFNIVNSSAEINVLMDKPWNHSKEAEKELDGCSYSRVLNLGDAIDFILLCLHKEQENMVL